MWQIPCKMTNSSSKPLQTLGKWYQPRNPKKNPKPAQKKIPKTISHPFPTCPTFPNISQPICWQWNDMERISWDFTTLRGSNRWFSEVWHFFCNWDVFHGIWLHLTHKSRGCITSRSASEMIAGIWDDLVLCNHCTAVDPSMSSWHWWRCTNQSFDS